MAAQLLLGLSILVGLHELGHLVAAKMFGMRVEKYSIGFPPKIWGKQFGETEYSIGMIPLGGFVKISGMIDESLDTKTLSSEPEPWEFRAKPAWQRLIVMLGGIIVNVITGVVIFILLVYSNGESYLSKEELNKHGIVAYDLGEQLGLQTGDRIVNVNGQDYEKYSDLRSPDVLLGTDGFYTVDRNGERITVPIPNNFIDKFADKNVAFFEPRLPFKVGQVLEESNAAKGGLQAGDRFVAVEGKSLSYFDQFKSALDTLAGKTIQTQVERDGQRLALTFDVTDEGTIGFAPQRDEDRLAYSHRDFSFGEATVNGTEQAFNVVFYNIKAFGKMFSGDVSPSKSLSGPIGIAQFFGGTWDWSNFWRITGLLSMVLAFMNLLPIPALDGGHVMFLTWEIVTGRKPSDKFLENAQKVGMVLLLGLMSYAIFNDVYKLF
ncbi:site-2 protease [Marinoscillum furvescens DSM 4134]|uniref:Zinc metalloprotease n=2 Tax=Marinoscillum furvescens TaxID=1026 RepID=A0A3D9KVN7_MARFU|nr:site-2 protease [Marinoscillum furvescens DSM 4134]